MNRAFAILLKPRVETVIILALLIEYLLMRTFVAGTLLSLIASGFRLSSTHQTYHPLAFLLWLTGFAGLLHLSRVAVIASDRVLEPKAVIVLWLIFAPRATRYVNARFSEDRKNAAISYETSLIEISTALGVIFLVLVPSYIRSGGMPTWVMSGDSRNHLLITREVVNNGGFLWWRNYPSLFNSLTSVAGGWNRSGFSLSSGELTSMIQVQAIIVALLLFLMTLSIASVINQGAYLGLHDSGRNFINSVLRLAAGAVLSAGIVTSNWFLRSILEEGFFPILLTLFIVSNYLIHIVDNRDIRSLIVTSLLTTFLLLSTYPPTALLPILVGVFNVAFSSISREGNQPANRLHMMSIILSISSIIAAWILGRMTFAVDLIKNYLGASGRISALDIPTAAVLLLIIFLILFRWHHFQKDLNADLPQVVPSLLRLVYPLVTTLALTIVVLSHAIGPSYYRDKSVVVLFSLCIIAFVVALRQHDPLLKIGPRVGSLIPITAVTMILTFLPIQGDSGFRLPPTFDLAVGWQLPTDNEAALIRQIDMQSPGSVPFNLTGDSLAQRVMTIWTTGALPTSGESVTWAYAADVSNLAVVCDFAMRFEVSVVAVGNTQNAPLSVLC